MSQREIIDKLSSITQVPANNIVLGLLSDHKLTNFVDTKKTA